MSYIWLNTRTWWVAPFWWGIQDPGSFGPPLNSALHQRRLAIMTGCLRPTPTDNLPVLAGIQPAELRHKGATLSPSTRGITKLDGARGKKQVWRPPYSNLRSFRSKCTVLKKILVTLLGIERNTHKLWLVAMSNKYAILKV